MNGSIVSRHYVSALQFETYKLHFHKIDRTSTYVQQISVGIQYISANELLNNVN